MTLAEFIARYESANVTPIRRPAAGTVTPLGLATVATYRAIRAICELPPEQRAVVLALFAEEARGVVDEIAHGPA